MQTKLRSLVLFRFVPVFPVLLLGMLAVSSGCVTVRPEQRSVLADPVMRFDGEELAQGQKKHALDNREGSTGGGGVSGGGCGCN